MVSPEICYHRYMTNRNLQTATFGAGCFWGVEDTFMKIKGVEETAVGFMGGATPNPTYEQTTTGQTGHAEVIHLQYEPNVVSYEELLKTFWDIHDPTTLNRQGPDIGTQYRSVIFYHTPEQKNAAEKSKEKLGNSEQYEDPIVTEIVPAGPFYRAEEYHQKYFQKTGRRVCH